MNQNRIKTFFWICLVSFLSATHCSLAETRVTQAGVFYGDGGHGTVEYDKDSVTCVYEQPGTWSYLFQDKYKAQPYEIFKYGVDIQINHIDGAGDVFFAVRIGDSEDNTIHMLYAPLSPDFSVSDWHRVEGEFVVPRRGESFQLQVWANGPSSASMRNPTVERIGSYRDVLNDERRKPVILENELMEAYISLEDWSFIIRDKRTDKTWKTFPGDEQVLVLGKKIGTSALEAVFDAIYLPAHKPMTLSVLLESDAPEFAIRTEMPDDTPMPSWAAMVNTIPDLFFPDSGVELVVPYGEGFLYPVDDPTIPHQLMAMGDGAGLTMPWFGAVDKADGAAILCYTHDEDDVLTRLNYHQEKDIASGTMRLHWMSQKDHWGYDRTARFWLADTGGYVALAKRYRQDAIERGRLVTLAEKQSRLPQIDRLLGAPNCWFNFIWHLPTQDERLEALQWFHEQGMDRAILSNADPLENTETVISWGWLTSQYDLYIDVWPEEEAPLAHAHGRTWGFPEGIQRLRTGVMKRGWVQKTPHGEFPSYNLCPSQHLKWAEVRISESLEARKMLSRLIDTTTALPLDQCFHPDHPMTRSQDKAHRLELLTYVRDRGLIVGSEMGVDWAMPLLCYVEGMLSPVAYRHPEAGYLMSGMEPTENTYRYQLNPGVRVPLWGLVYRDCAVAYWYWGDANNTFPALWPLRNAFNALYVTPPLYMILDDYQMYLDQRERIVETDRFLKPLFDAVGFSEMADHQFLSEDRLLQRTVFANGVEVVVNFDKEPRTYNEITIAPLGYEILDLNQEEKDNVE